MAEYLLMPRAWADLHDISETGRSQWGEERSARYMRDLRSGFDYIASRPHAVSARNRLAGVSELSLHRVGVHYIVFKPIDGDTIAIVALLHERMDVSTRLKELKAGVAKEIGDLRAQRLRDMLRPK